MEKKDERPSTRVPAGTFAASDPPPAPEHSSDPSAEPETPRAPGTGPRPPPPPPPDAGSARSRYTSTLMGHAVPPNSDGAPPPVAPVLAPPKWRGAKAYLDGQEPKPRVSAIAATTPLVAPEGAPPMPSHVNTKLGRPLVAPPPPPPAAAPLVPNPEAAIDQAIERMLEGQTSVPMEVDAPEIDEVDQLEELPMDEAVPLDEPSERAVPLARVALKTTPIRTGATPASAGDAAANGDRREPAEPAPATVRAAAEPESPPQAGARAASSEPSQPEAAREPAPRAAAHGETPIAERAGSAEARRAAASPARVAPVADGALREFRGDPQLRWGALLLAAMVAVGAGGWFLTGGGFRRSVPPPSAVLPVKAEPTPEPLPEVVPPNATAKAPVPAADKVAAVLESAAPTRPSTEPSASTPRSSTRREPDSARARSQTETASGDQPPVMRVVPRDSSEQAASTPSETPTRREVLDALEPLRPAVERCANGQRGVAQLDITVVNTGTVTHAVVAGDFAGTPEGSCIALAARGAKFAPFQKPRFRVIYPFAL